ncbi:hypothetical protein MSG28_008473, partial [Choristoneura fumiferana]
EVVFVIRRQILQELDHRPVHRSITQCARLLWCARFFAEAHAAQCATAALRALAHHAAGAGAAVDVSLHFLCDLLNGVAEHEAIAALSHQSAFSVDQIIACLISLAPRINTNPRIILTSSLVLHALVSYQPEDLAVTSHTAAGLVKVLSVWFELLVGALNHSMLVEDREICGMFFAVTCQLGVDVLRLSKLLSNGRQTTDFVQSILADDQEVDSLKQCARALDGSIHRVMLELVVFTKDNQKQIATEEYEVFLKFLLDFFYGNAASDQLPDFCDVLFSSGYLAMLPQVQIARNDTTIRKMSTLVLGEMLKGLADKYLDVDSSDSSCARDIHMGLIELQFGIEKPHSIGNQLQKSQPYSLLVYIYFYCQSSENPEEATAPLLPYLVEHILRLSKSFNPPSYIVKALWLMSTISSGSLASLDERVYLEKATDRLVGMLHPEPSVYYTHNPALLLWAFTSQRIPNQVRVHVLSEWFKTEDSVPSELTSEPIVWELLLNILIQSKEPTVLQNCVKSLYSCLEETDEDSREDFGLIIWPMLPGVLSKALIANNNEIETNICYLLELSFMLVPVELEQNLCLKLAVLTTAVFTKNNEMETKSRYDFEYALLLTYMNRPGFLPSVLFASNSLDNRVMCIALQLLSYISLREDSTSERGASLLQLVYMVLNSGPNTPLVLTYSLEVSPSETQQCNALRALMLRIQMLCCRESKSQSSAGWKTLSAIFKHAIIFKNDPKLVATLTSQPWTQTLICFQLTQNITDEFLTFTITWISLLKITIKKAREEKRSRMFKQSLICKTLLMLKKHLVVEDGLIDVKHKILIIVKELLEDSDIQN